MFAVSEIMMFVWSPRHTKMIRIIGGWGFLHDMKNCTTPVFKIMQHYWYNSLINKGFFKVVYPKLSVEIKSYNVIGIVICHFCFRS